jgi:signal transduction histidine kinase/CheY-like chemotaxis protein
MNVEAKATGWREELDRDLQLLAGASVTEAGPFAGWLAGGGEMGERIRAFDWSATSIGAPESWSPALRMMIRFLLANRLPWLLWWGPQYISIYNDAYRPVLGTKHPWALGQPLSECWKEIWPILQPLVDTPFKGGPATWDDDILLQINRHGFVEETHFTIAYSPVPDEDAPSGIGGVLATVHEITEKIVGERRLGALRDLGAAAIERKTVEEACSIALGTLGKYTKDLPFCLLYLIPPEEGRAHLACAAGAVEGSRFCPKVVELGADARHPWSQASSELVRTKNVQIVDDLAHRFGDDVPSGPWSDPPRQALVLPIRASIAHKVTGFLIAGVSSRLELDESYRAFYDLLVSQIAAMIANARAYDEERKRAEALAAIDRAKTAFFSNVSHEFRTPLTLMLGPLEDALNDRTSSRFDPSQRDRLTVVHRNSLRLLKLVNNLLDFSRIEAARVRASFQPTDLARFTAELASNFVSATERAGLELRIDCPPLRDAVFVDRDMWEKIVLNLVSNAFKFTFAGAISVETKASSDGAAAELTVRDTGTGIPAAELPRLFERFHRIEGAQGRTFEGSGIGLALVNELVKQHGGTIGVASEAGRGSCFTVRIPFGASHLPRDRIVAAEDALSPGSRAEAYVQEALRWLPEAGGGSDAPGAAADDLAVDVAAGPGQGERILLVDDSADMREYIRRLLVDRGFAVEAVADGAAALAAARRQRPDLVLSDVMMPGLGGFGLLAALRGDEHLRRLPIILLSARAGEEARVEGLDAGADDYVSKPFSARELLARVRANLQLARMRREVEEAERDHAARLAAVVNTIPTAVWYTYDPGAERIFANAHAARLLRMPRGANASLSASLDELAPFRIFRGDRRVAADDLPLRRAARGETVQGEELDIRFRDGTSVTLLLEAAPLRDASGRIHGAVCGAVDITERKRQHEHRELLLNELNHRVKNTLATVQSFAVQTLRTAPTIADGRHAFEARLIALSKGHDVLTRENWAGAGLHEVVAEALGAYVGDARQARVAFDGPEIRLRPKTALAISMALHELATNAVKHGALSREGGRVDLGWVIEGAPPTLKFRWVERGGPEVLAPRKRGFGSRMIEQGLALDLGGRVRLDFAPEGVVCTIEAPLDENRANGGFPPAGEA